MRPGSSGRSPRRPSDDAPRYRWDLGDGTVAGPSENLAVARRAHEREGSYAPTLEVDDGDGESPFLMGLSVVRDGERIRFAGDLGEGSYPVAVVRNELPIGTDFHGAGGSVVLLRWEDGRVEPTFSAHLEEILGALDLLDTPTPTLRPAPTASVRGSFAHQPRRSLRGGSGSLDALSGATHGDWYLCAPRDPSEVEEVVPAPDLATAGGAARDVPLIDFEAPEIVVPFSRPADIGSAVENVVLEWRRATGAYEEVPILVMGEGDDTLRLAPLDDSMDGVVYRAVFGAGVAASDGTRQGEPLARSFRTGAGTPERAILGDRLFLTANRAEGDVVRIGARGAAFEVEALLEPGPPTRPPWTLRPSE